MMQCVTVRVKTLMAAVTVTAADSQSAMVKVYKRDVFCHVVFGLSMHPCELYIWRNIEVYSAHTHFHSVPLKPKQ